MSHLAHCDDVALPAVTEPERFPAEPAAAVVDGGIDPDQIAARYRSLPPAALLDWFDSAASGC